jgi:hypothetical protein
VGSDHLRGLHDEEFNLKESVVTTTNKSRDQEKACTALAWHASPNKENINLSFL